MEADVRRIGRASRRGRSRTDRALDRARAIGHAGRLPAKRIDRRRGRAGSRRAGGFRFAATSRPAASATRPAASRFGSRPRRSSADGRTEALSYAHQPHRIRPRAAFPARRRTGRLSADGGTARRSEIQHSKRAARSEFARCAHRTRAFGRAVCRIRNAIYGGDRGGRIGTRGHPAQRGSVHSRAGESGETIAEALRPTSEFRRHLADHDPSQTTATIWVYPDSFADFRVLQTELTRLGFATAARPLPPGVNVSASSEHGSRSAAQ